MTPGVTLSGANGPFDLWGEMTPGVTLSGANDLLFYHSDLFRHAKGRVVIYAVHLLADSDRNIICLAFLQAADSVGSIICTENDFGLRSDHVLPLAILKDIAVSAGGLVILDGHLAGCRVLHGADDDRLEAVHQL